LEYDCNQTSGLFVPEESMIRDWLSTYSCQRDSTAAATSCKQRRPLNEAQQGVIIVDQENIIRQMKVEL
jgi:hypothetical protein